MIVPVWQGGQVVKANGEFTDSYLNHQEQVRQQLQLGVSNNGFLIPSVTSAELATIQANPNSLPGTLLFNSQTINGGSSDAPNGQLFIKLGDGTFHPIANL